MRNDRSRVIRVLLTAGALAVAVFAGVLLADARGWGGLGMTPTLAPGMAAAKVRGVAAAADGDSVYFLGLAFEGLAVAFIEPPDSNGIAWFGYGRCHHPMLGEGGCGLPLEVQTMRFSVPWAAIRGCHRQPPLRGMPIVRFGGDLAMFTGDPLLLVTVHANSRAQGLRAMAALRPVRDSRSAADMVPPTSAAIAQIDRTCGSAPTHSDRLP